MALDIDQFKAALDMAINIVVLRAADIALVNTQYSPRAELINARGTCAKHFLGSAPRTAVTSMNSACSLLLKRVRVGIHRRVVRTLGRASSFQTRRSSESSKTPISLASSKPYF